MFNKSNIILFISFLVQVIIYLSFSYFFNRAPRASTFSFLISIFIIFLLAPSSDSKKIILLMGNLLVLITNFFFLIKLIGRIIESA